MVLVTVNRSFGTASVCHKDKIVLCKQDSLFDTFYLAFNCGCNFLMIFKFKDNIRYFSVELEVDTCMFQIFLHWKNQRFVLVVFCEFQRTEIRESCNMVNEALEIQLHF